MKSGTKINQLFQKTPPVSILLSSWLKSQGYSYELQQQYRKNGWLVSIGKGAMIRKGQDLLLAGAIFALQKQAKISIHIGGRTALGLQGYAHFVEIDNKETILFAPRTTKLPSWFRNNNWDSKPVLNSTSFLPPDIGLTSIFEGGVDVLISNPTRAIMECLALAPNRFDLTEAFEIMNGLVALRPNNVQNILEQCKSLKVKRLFLFFADKAQHSWFKHLDLSKIDLGTGKRSLMKNGVFIPKYNITVPSNLA
jgi:hypothetical protein